MTVKLLPVPFNQLTPLSLLNSQVIPTSALVPATFTVPLLVNLSIELLPESIAKVGNTGACGAIVSTRTVTPALISERLPAESVAKTVIVFAFSDSTTFANCH